MGGRALGFFVLSSGLSAALGLLLVDLVEPGAAVDPGTRGALLEAYRDETPVGEVPIAARGSGGGVGGRAGLSPGRRPG